MRLSLGQLLTSLFTIILLVVVAQGVYAVTALNTILDGTNQIVDKRVPSFIIMGQINADIGDIRIAQSSYINADPARKSEFAANLKAANETLATNRKSYEPLMVDQGDRDLYAAFSKDWILAEQLWQKIKSLDDSGNQAEAEAARQKAEGEKLRLQQDAEAAAQKKLQEATAGLASGLKRLAAGDLGFELKEPFAPEFDALRIDLNSAVSQLGNTIATVAGSAGAISEGSREVSHSADDLSKRTEQQAASLEQTAAALDQITVNVTNSSRRVEEARGVAKDANSSAVRSGQVVHEAITAMQRIEQSSNQISSIISVIDEIAFQTNLLALNAGVEAARAGEAGRGFAVVATEVRELAQRSAKAAREIKDLINKSSQEVENGVRQVQETGDVLKAIEVHVTTINGLMDAIATSSREQSVGLSEVNTAVNQMDQVTQQNAAMVEETSAASASLAQESVRLQQLVSRFIIPAGERGFDNRRAA